MRLERETWPVDDAFIRDWNALSQSGVGATVFSDWEWIRANIETYPQVGGEILPFRFVGEDGATLGMGMLMRSDQPKSPVNRRVIRTLDNNVMRIPPILMKDRAQVVPAMDLLAREFRGEVDFLDFFKIDGLGGLTGEVRQSLAGAGVPCVLDLFNEQPRVHFTDSWDDYYRSRRGSTWKSLRRMRRKVNDEVGEVRFVRLRSPTELDEKLDDAMWEAIREVHRNSWQYDNGKVDPDQHFEFYRGVIEAMSPKDMADVNLLYAKDKLLAFDLNLRQGKTVFAMFGAYDQAYRKWGPGTVVLAEWVEDSHKRGDRIIEFGGDHLSYKGDWAQEYEIAYHLRIRGKRLWGRLSALRGNRLVPKPANPLFTRVVGRLKRLGLPKCAFDYSQFFVVRMPCMNEPAESKGMSWRELTREDIPAMCECRGVSDPVAAGTLMASRMDGGSPAVGLFVADRLEAYVFAHLGRNILEDMDHYQMNLGDDGCYLYDSWVRPTSRGKGLYPWLIYAIQRHMILEHEARYFVSTVESSNMASMRVHAKVGAQCVERVTYVALLGLCRYSCRNRNGYWGAIDYCGGNVRVLSHLFPLA